MKRMKDGKQNKKFLCSTLFGNMGKATSFEITSYKRDAAHLLANRIQKKLRQVFQVLIDFSAF